MTADQRELLLKAAYCIDDAVSYLLLNGPTHGTIDATFAHFFTNYAELRIKGIIMLLHKQIGTKYALLF